LTWEGRLAVSDNKEQVERLFLEHYLTLVGKDNQKVKLADHLNLDDIME